MGVICRRENSGPGAKAVTEACAILAEDMSKRRFSETAASGGRFSVRTQGAERAAMDCGEGTRVRIRSTTVICVRRGSDVVMAADGQVTMGEAVFKHTANKIRRLYQDKILAGFAGSTADAFSLFSRFENQAGAVRRKSGPVCRGAGKGLAHRQNAAQSGGVAGGGGPEPDLFDQRIGRRHRAG